MFVDEILSEAKNIIGKCDDSEVFRRITDAVKLANNQSAGNDWNVGIMDLCVCDGYVTLPADVGTILAVNSDGQPTLIRDQWYQFHVNGTGVTVKQPWGYTDELGQVSTYRDPLKPSLLVAVTENSKDSGIELRVFGWDENGKRIYTPGPSGVLEDGMLVPVVFGFSLPNPSAPLVARIDRVKKPATNGFIRVLAIDPDDASNATQVGYYQPWETVPSYRRIRVPDRNWVRIKYRRRDLEVRGSADWINLDNREALFLLLKAVVFRLKNQLDMAKSYEAEGMRLLSNQAESLKPPGIKVPQVIFADGIPSQHEDRLFY